MPTESYLREHDDKMRYDFYCKFNRQPTDDEAKQLATILAKDCYASYDYVKSKK